MSTRRRGKNRVKQRYECATDGCEAHQMISVHPTDADRSIGYVCEACQRVTEHVPAGVTDWY